LAAALAGLAAIFLSQPLRRFYDLREECRDQMLYFANVRVPDAGESDAALREHQQVVRRLGTRMSAFADTRTVAAFVVKLQGYDPSTAAAGLIGLSNALPQYGAERKRWRTQVEQALKFPS
jgi:hypothetical protein